jgi:hypothetical protein
VFCGTAGFQTSVLWSCRVPKWCSVELQGSKIVFYGIAGFQNSVLWSCRVLCSENNGYYDNAIPILILIIILLLVRIPFLQ